MGSPSCCVDFYNEQTFTHSKFKSSPHFFELSSGNCRIWSIYLLYIHWQQIICFFSNRHRNFWSPYNMNITIFFTILRVLPPPNCIQGLLANNNHTSKFIIMLTYMLKPFLCLRCSFSVLFKDHRGMMKAYINDNIHELVFSIQ